MDLNLVKVFVAVHETLNLTTASRRLFVTQSAVSQSLARLRREFDDPLFERSGRGMRPTALADAVYPRFRGALEDIDRALDGVRGFDPSASMHTFRIALSELGEIGWMPDIITRIHAEAPQVRVEVVALEPDLLADALNRGAVDLAISPAAVRGAFEPTHVKQERYNALVSRDHDLALSELTVESYAATRHVALTSDTGGPVLDVARRRSGVTIQPAVTIRHLATLPQLLVRDPSLMATIPETIAMGWASSLPLVALELPFEMEPIEIVLYRRRTSQDIGALEWFHRAVARAVAGSPGEFSAIVPGSDD